jgi:heptosyltransferase-2
VTPFGIDTKDLSSEISFDERDSVVAKKFISEIQKEPGSIVIGLHVGAGKPANRWSLKKYVELIQKINSTYNSVFYLTGSDSDSEELDFVVSNTKVYLNKYLNKEIPQVAALISNSNLFITNDTGIMHVAGTTLTSQVSLFGPTNPFNWAPCGKNKIFLRKSDLIDDIEVEEVFDICKVLLESK